ncbi:hypothetical protein E4U32_005604 [Claviceps aff. humidiphila group G2b]|nr:hypothetical protein E4U32_005604 [Claviceps aff. humidiphila group G2b]
MWHDGSDYCNETSSEDYNDSFGPFHVEEDNAIERFPREENNSDEVVGSSMERRAVVGRKGGDYRYNDTEQPELDRLRIKWVPRSAVESNDHIHTVFLLEILSIIGRPDLERPYQNWIFHSRNQ